MRGKKKIEKDTAKEVIVISSDSDFDDVVTTVSEQSRPASRATEHIEACIPEYVVEEAKSGRAECKKCGTKIPHKDIRVGIIVDGDWGISTRWQHLPCTVFDKRIVNAESLDGFTELDSAAQHLVRQRVRQSQNEVDQDMVPLNPDELVRKDWNIPIDPGDDLLMPLLPYQKEGLGWMLHQEQSQMRGGILADEMGMGKAQPLDSRILTPVGWVTMGDIKVGDRVIGSNGCGTPVTGVYHRGVRQTFWVQMNDGCGVEVSDDHLWLADEGENSWQVLSTRYLYHDMSKKYLCASPRKTWRIPTVKSVHFEIMQDSNSFLLDPYTFGVLLSSAVNCDTPLALTVDENEWEHFSRTLNIMGDVWDDTSTLTERLVMGNNLQSRFKQILSPYFTSHPPLPSIAVPYLMGSVEHRTKILRGILDMNGKIDCSGQHLYILLTSESQYFCDIVLDVVRSLGGIAEKIDCSLGISGYCNKWTVKIDMTATHINPFSIFPKASIYASKAEKCVTRSRYITSISPLRQTKVACISVKSSDHLYVTDNYIVTHNTIQTISTILGNRPRQQSREQRSTWDRSDKEHGRQPDHRLRANTLVVVPTVAIRQWQTEIKRFTRPGSLTLHVYHGDSRAGRDALKMLQSADVVITSYKILELEYRRETAGKKITCSICGKKYYPEKLRMHRKYFCGESSKRTIAQSKTERKRSNLNRKAPEVFEVGDSESSEDDIDRQKRIIRTAKSDRSVVELKGPKKMSRKRKVLSSDDSSSEDDIDRQKQMIRKSRTSNNSKGIGTKKKGSEDSRLRTNGVNKSRRSGKSSKRITSSKKSLSASDSDYADSASSSSEEDDDASSSKAKSKYKAKKFIANDDWEDLEVEKAIALATKKATRESVPSLLHSVSWFRVVLDEAHLIKDRSTSTAKAVFNLVSLNKWCLTGTPLQNRVGELYSLVRFLRMDPFAFYFCRTKSCNCKSLHYRFTNGLCDDCGHTAMQHFCHFNKHILNPIKRTGYIGEGKRAMLTLKEQVLDEILLRRTKNTRSSDIQLPQRIVKVRMDKMDLQEEDFYQALYTQSQAQFNTYVASGTVLHNYAHIFDILIRLRQVVDHPYLVLHSDKYYENGMSSYDSSAAASTAISTELNSDLSTCGFCHEPIEEPRLAQCGHCFCEPCVLEYLNVLQSESATDSAVCPQCEKPLSVELEKPRDSATLPDNGLSIWDSSKSRKKSFLSKIKLDSFQSSTKLEALMQELNFMLSADPGAKAIVFSQFVNFLDLIEYRIQLGGINCSKLVGSMNIDARDKIIKNFHESPDMSVLLISLKAGGVALNLTAANYIFIMDPWWNPAAEMQAIDRTHRLGQHKPIFATRFIVEDSIEERILRLQEKKKLVFDGTVGGDASSMVRLTVDDMRFLFQ